jgi:hypothetical protein
MTLIATGALPEVKAILEQNGIDPKQVQSCHITWRADEGLTEIEVFMLARKPPKPKPKVYSPGQHAGLWGEWRP